MVATEYGTFLGHLDQLFAVEGAHQLLTDDPGLVLPIWTRGWDRLVMTSAPGRQMLYAIRKADGDSPSTLRAYWDGLVAGMAERGALSVPSLEMVVVAVYSSAVEASVRRQVHGLTPSAYIPGLRPSTWIVSLTERRVWGGRPWNKPHGVTLLEEALNPSVVPQGRIEALQQARRSQTDAFYRLMRGRQPVVTYALIVVNVLMYLITVALGGPNNEGTLQRLGALTYNLALQGQWWRLFTTMFLHGGIEHILFNMMSLFAVGTLAERLYGSGKYLAIYIGSGLIASATSLAWAALHNNLSGTAIGASGAIFGVAGALVMVRFQPSDLIPVELRRRVTASMAPMVAISLPLSAFLAANVDSSAHVGGLIGGAILSMVFGVTRHEKEAVSRGFWLRRRSG